MLTANLAALYQQSQSPTPAQLTALANNPPTNSMISSINIPGERDLNARCQWQPESQRQRHQLPEPTQGLTAESFR